MEGARDGRKRTLRDLSRALSVLNAWMAVVETEVLADDYPEALEATRGLWKELGGLVTAAHDLDAERIDGGIGQRQLGGDVRHVEPGAG